MDQTAKTVVVLIALILSAAAGMAVQGRLRDHHRNRDTMDFVRLVMTMLVTLVALILGLLTSSVKANYDSVAGDVRGYSVQIIDLNRLLVAYGPETAPARALLLAYTKAAVATTWTHEKPPPGTVFPPTTPDNNNIESAALGRMLSQIDRQILALHPATPTQERLAAEARTRFDSLMQRRWKLIEEAPGEFSGPFYLVMIFWLIIIFACFGLTAPRNTLACVTIFMAAVALTLTVFVILDMSGPFDGLFIVPSAPLRDAVMHLARTA